MLVAVSNTKLVSPPPGAQDGAIDIVVVVPSDTHKGVVQAIPASGGLSQVSPGEHAAARAPPRWIEFWCVPGGATQAFEAVPSAPCGQSLKYS